MDISKKNISSTLSLISVIKSLCPPVCASVFSSPILNPENFSFRLNQLRRIQHDTKQYPLSGGTFFSKTIEFARDYFRMESKKQSYIVIASEFWHTLCNESIEKQNIVAQSKSRFSFKILFLFFPRSFGLLQALFLSSSHFFLALFDDVRQRNKTTSYFSLLEYHSLSINPLLIVAWPFVVIHSFQPFQVQRTNKSRSSNSFYF